MKLNASSTACVSIDMHRGHLDPTVATLPLAAERCGPLIARTAELFRGLRTLGVPIVHVVSEFRDSEEAAANPFWKSIHDDPTKARKGLLRHNLAGSPGTEISPDLYETGDLVVRGKKRYSAFFATDLEFLLRRRLGADTVILTGVNTSSCILCSGFEATNRDFRVVIAEEGVDSMDGEDAHRFALRILAATSGWVMTNQAIVKALQA
jgi:nicotinamidase-related amidase